MSSLSFCFCILYILLHLRRQAGCSPIKCVGKVVALPRLEGFVAGNRAGKAAKILFWTLVLAHLELSRPLDLTKLGRDFRRQVPTTWSHEITRHEFGFFPCHNVYIAGKEYKSLGYDVRHTMVVFTSANAFNPPTTNCGCPGVRGEKMNRLEMTAKPCAMDGPSSSKSAAKSKAKPRVKFAKLASGSHISHFTMYKNLKTQILADVKKAGLPSSAAVPRMQAAW